MIEVDWLDVFEVGLRQLRPEWSLSRRDSAEFLLDQVEFAPCLVVGPWDAKVIVRGDQVVVFFGGHRFQHQLYLGDPLLLEKLIVRVELDGTAPETAVEVPSLRQEPGGGSEGRV